MYGATEEPTEEPRPQRTALEALAAYFAEFMGTFVFVFTAGCCALSPVSAMGQSMAIAAVFTAMVYATGTDARGYLNPAVSFSLTMTGSLMWRDALNYVAVHLLGGILGAWSCFLLLSRQFSVGPVAPFGCGEALFAEAIFTFMLSLVANGCASSKWKSSTGKGKEFHSLAVGLALMAGSCAISEISGACLNPAVALGLAASGRGLGWAFAWVAAELVGALCAAAVFHALKREGDRVDHLPSMSVRCASEFVGTFLLTLSAGLNMAVNSHAVGLSVAATMACMVHSLGNTSGGLFNPAITLGMATSSQRKYTGREAVVYGLVQITGGVVAGMFSAHFHAVGPHSALTSGLEFGRWNSLLDISLLELHFTFVLVYAALRCAASELHFCSPLIIGCAVLAGSVAAGSVSGAKLNPAVSAGVVMADLTHHNEGGPQPLANFVIISLCELLGGLLASGAFRLSQLQGNTKEVPAWSA